MIADDLDGVLVRADRSVRTESVEFAGGRTCGSGVEFLREIERRVGNVFVNTDGEVVFLGSSFFEVFL